MTDSRVYVVPKEGLRVLDPDKKPPAPLPAVGAWVPWNGYWCKCVLDGDVERTDPPLDNTPTAQAQATEAPAAQQPADAAPVTDAAAATDAAATKPAKK